jgi:hypothetical protein
VYVHAITDAGGALGFVPDAAIGAQLAALDAAYGPWGFRFALSEVGRVSSAAWASLSKTDGWEPQDARDMKAALRRGGARDLNLYLIPFLGDNLGWSTFPGGARCPGRGPAPGAGAGGRGLLAGGGGPAGRPPAAAQCDTAPACAPCPPAHLHQTSPLDPRAARPRPQTMQGILKTTASLSWWTPCLACPRATRERGGNGVDAAGSGAAPWRPGGAQGARLPPPPPD